MLKVYDGRRTPHYDNSSLEPLAQNACYKRSALKCPIDSYYSSPDIPIALIILNQPLALPRKHFDTLWKKASTTLVTDGAANRLYEYLGTERDNYIPQRLSGDFDSIKPEVKQFYKDKGSEIIPTPDQDYTDFTKGLTIVSDVIKDKEVGQIIVLGSYGGRMDHVMANIDTLCQAEKLTKVKVLLLGEDQVTFLLNKGSHKIYITDKYSVDWCGLIPMGAPCKCITTTGLKWNLENQGMQFGELISTSNIPSFQGEGVVTVDTDAPLLWTMGYTMKE
ncbi:hypothetical protein FSP39_005263 [Pinctada imbricata]|uniref:Thiamine pyrophosphokinase n=1 Tax=Pinctada imbricata TaxID=66713 RepID=A0AA88XJJ5_PINIB|nr:hypothetical protein FSP39_005263 [Pinctada imbricata]